MLIYRILAKRDCLGLILLTAVLIGASSCFNTGHPMPMREEVYEARDPDSGTPVLRLVTTWWTDDAYKSGPHIAFRQSDGSIWKVDAFSSEPGFWEVLRSHPEKGTQKIPLHHIYTTQTGPPSLIRWELLEFDIPED